MKRRTFLQGTIAAGAAGAAIGTGLIAPATVFAETAASPFTIHNFDEALATLKIELEESDQVSIRAPEIAENGAVVPVTISSTLDGTTELGILVQENPTPLAALFKLGEGAEATATTRIKMGKTSNVIAYARVGDKTYVAKQEVKVTIGGCGG